jgi:hypothetical protein
MKKFNKLLMVLFLCATVSACGGGNDEAENSANLFNSQFNNTGLAPGCGVSFTCNGTKTLAEFRSDVANMLFAPSSSSHDFTFESYTNELVFDDIWIFNYSYNNLDTEFFNRGAGSNPIHEEGTTQSAIRDHILSIIDGANQFAPVSNQIFDVQVGNSTVGAVYRIDLSFPIEANPIIKYGTSDGYYFFSAN